MTKPLVVEKAQFDHMLLAVAGNGKVRGFSQYPERDKAMLHEDCGIVGGSMQSARRTYAVVVSRAPANSFNWRNLAEALGTGVSAARRIATQGPKSLADVVRTIAKNGFL